MASMGPNAQRRYFGSGPTAPPSTASLLPQQQPASQPAFTPTSSNAGSTLQPNVNNPTPSIRSVTSNGSMRSDINPFGAGATRAGGKTPSIAPSISEKYSLAPDPYSWGSELNPSHAEPDDFLHNPDPRRDRKTDGGGHIFTSRGFANLGCITILGLALLTLFAGYPIITYFTKTTESFLGGFNFGGINATGQVPSIAGNHGLIDLDTPKDAYTKPSLRDEGTDMQLIFSDEFNRDGRSFYPGDDPYWEAVDLHYWSTNNMEWYDPSAITTADGALEITLSRKETHQLHYQGGMMSTWNKFCFTGGLVETAVTLPGASNVMGLWPAIWMMGNLGRAGYGATLEGTWPFTYDACDVGTLKNQTLNSLPTAATINGDKGNGGALSYLPGQKLSRCTCPGESHPGPVHSDGTYVGRAAPEIDIFEAQVTGALRGEVSQSGQWAPFDESYTWNNNSDNLIIYDETVSELNTYKGGAYQQASSVVTFTDPNCYEIGGTGCFSVYGLEYKPGFDDAYITWIADNKKAWTVNAAGLGANPLVEISARPVPQEPMYLLMNLGMSTNFGTVDLEHIDFPVKMRVDYIRVYQDISAYGLKVGCDPDDFPTAKYIETYIEAYTNPNLTTWVDDYKQPWPKNSLLGQC